MDEAIDADVACVTPVIPVACSQVDETIDEDVTPVTPVTTVTTVTRAQVDEAIDEDGSQTSWVSQLPPITLLHGTSDKTCPHDQSQRFRDNLLRAGVTPAKFVRAPRPCYCGYAVVT